MEKRTYYIWATFLLVVFILRIFDSIYNNVAHDLFWFCVANLFLLVLGLYLRSNFLISSVVVSSFITETFWLFDVISFLIWKKLFFGVAGYLFFLRPLEFILTFYHIFLLVVPLYIVFKERNFHKYAWIFSSFYFFVIALLSLSLPGHNVNCVRALCEMGVFDFLDVLNTGIMPVFVLTWLFNTLVLFIPINYLFYYLVKRKRKKKTKK